MSQAPLRKVGAQPRAQAPLRMQVGAQPRAQAPDAPDEKWGDGVFPPPPNVAPASKEFVYFRIYQSKPKSVSLDENIWRLLPDTVLGQDRLRIIGEEIFGTSQPIDYTYISLAKEAIAPHHTTNRVTKLVDSTKFHQPVKAIEIKVEVEFRSKDVMSDILKGSRQSLAIWRESRDSKNKNWLLVDAPAPQEKPIAWVYSLVTPHHPPDKSRWQRIHFRTLNAPIANNLNASERKIAEAKNSVEGFMQYAFAPLTAPRVIQADNPTVELFFTPNKVVVPSNWSPSNTFISYWPLQAHSLPGRRFWRMALSMLDCFIKQSNDTEINAAEKFVHCYIVTI